MTLILLNALLPIFVGLILGYIAGRRGVMDNLNVQNLIVLVMGLPNHAYQRDTWWFLRPRFRKELQFNS
jgi:hypothetical protein